MRRLLSLLLLSLGLLPAAVLLPGAARAQCEGVASAPPADSPPGVRVVQYSSAPIVAGGAIVAQRNCFLLVNAGGDVQQTSARVFLSEQGGVPGPWFLDPGTVSSIDIADGAPASCSVPSPGVALVAPTSGFLLAGAASDPCCFDWYSTNLACEGLPLAGNQVEVQTSVGGQDFDVSITLEPPPGVPSGGVTCGLIGLEALLVVPLARRLRRLRGCG